MHILRHFLLMQVAVCLDILHENGKKSGEILRQFSDYQVIVHYDNTTFNDIGQFFITDSVESMMSLLYNYDVGHFKLKRPLGYKMMHLVFLSDPFDFEKYSAVRFNLCYLDVVILVVRDFVLKFDVELNYQLKSVWMLDGLDSSSLVILYDINKEDFYCVKFYIGTESGKLNKITVEETDALPDLPGHMNEFEDFNGHVFYVAYYPYAPFIWCESEIVDGPGCNVKGIEGNILLLLSKYLNFTFVMKHADSQTSGSIWKDMIEDKLRLDVIEPTFFEYERMHIPSDIIEEKLIEALAMLAIGCRKYTDVVQPSADQSITDLNRETIKLCFREVVHFGRRNWAVGGMSTSSERMQLVDFTTMLHMESYTTFYVSPTIEAETWDGALRPFRVSTWIQLFIDIICIGFVIKFIAIVYNITRLARLADSITIPFYVIVEQSFLSNLRIRVFNLKLILSVWFLMSIIITTAYKSKLASTMIKPVKREPGSILDLYDEGYMFQVNNEDWSVLHENLAASSDQRYVDILDRCRNDRAFCEALAVALERRVAIIDEDTGMQYIILTTCRNYTPYQLSRFRRAKDYLFPSIHAWPMRFGAPYKYRFSITLQRLVDSGIIEYWYNKLISKPIPKSNRYDSDSIETGVLKISSYYGPMSILLIGQVISLLVLIAEILYFNFHSK